MAEKDVVFESKLKSSLIFDLKNTYQFAYEWLQSEQYDTLEKEYSEKIGASSKEVEIKWESLRKLSDYFKFQIDSSFRILRLTEVEVKDESGKVSKMNKGDFELKVKGTLIKDYDNKWVQNNWSKFYRGIYEKYVIPSRVKQYEDKLFVECDTYLAQMKSYLDLTGKK